MHDVLRRRILRKLETLPDAQLYQVLDYIEFLGSRYAGHEPTDARGLQKWAEKLEDGLRKRTVNPSSLREAFQLISAADRVLNSVSEAGKQLLDEFQWPEEERGSPDPPARGRGSGERAPDSAAATADDGGGSDRPVGERDASREPIRAPGELPREEG